MNCPDINIFQLMEEHLELILKEAGLKYVAFYTDSKKASNVQVSSASIIKSIISIGENICEKYENHIKDVLFTLLTGKCEVYVNLLGDFIFHEKEFSWSIFRVFLTFIYVLATISFKEKSVHLTDELIAYSAAYMESKLAQYIGKLEAWRAFEMDCAKEALKAEQYILHGKLQHSTQMSRQKQREFESLENNISDFVQISLEKQPCTKSNSAQVRKRNCITTADADILENDFTFAKSVLDNNTAADSLKQHENKCYSGLLITDNPIDYYNFRMQENSAASKSDLIVYVVHLSMKSLNKICFKSGNCFRITDV